MSGNADGAKKAQETIKKRYGVDEKGKSLHHAKAGAKGGATKPSKPRGFAKHPELAKNRKKKV